MLGGGNTVRINKFQFLKRGKFSSFEIKRFSSETLGIVVMKNCELVVFGEMDIQFDGIIREQGTLKCGKRIFGKILGALISPVHAAMSDEVRDEALHNLIIH